MTTEEAKGIFKEVLDTGKGLVETTKDRFKNSFIASLIISSIFLIWEPLLILIFSDKNIEERILYIKSVFHHEWYYYLIPLGVALIYVFVIPFLIWQLGRLSTKALIGIIDNNRKPIEHELIADINFQDRKRELTNRENTNKEIENLKSEIAYRQDQIKALNEKNESLQAELSTKLKTEKVAEKHIDSLKLNLEKVNSEYSLVKNKLKLKHSDLKKDYYIFQNSTLFSHFPTIIELMLEDHKSKDILTEQKEGEILSKYEQAGIIIPNRELGRYEFTEKGKVFYSYLEGIEALNDNLERIATNVAIESKFGKK